MIREIKAKEIYDTSVSPSRAWTAGVVCRGIARANVIRSGTRRAAYAGAKVSADRARDLAPAKAESVGMSTERLSRLDAAMKRLVDDKQVADLVTLVERHGKVVDFNAHGLLDVRKTGPRCKRTRSSASTR